MEKDNKKYRILLVEDNPGDALLVEEYLDDYILDPQITNAGSFKETKTLLTRSNQFFDIILLDLSLPDKNGEDLVRDIVQLSEEIPVVILTGYTDMPFSIRTMELGISDYLLKDTLTSFTLYKSILYNIDQSKFITAIEESEKRYNDLFHLSPQPMWVYDLETHKFMDVNDAAVKEYGYDHEEFLTMVIEDIQVVEGAKDPARYRAFFEEKRRRGKTEELHRLKNGNIIDVLVSSNELNYNNRKSRVTLANNITERNLYIKAIENQNIKLKEIAWIQSHVVRAPLARLMGVAELLKDCENTPREEQLFLLNTILNSAHELDDIIRDISSKTNKVVVKKERQEAGGH